MSWSSGSILALSPARKLRSGRALIASPARVAFLVECPAVTQRGPLVRYFAPSHHEQPKDFSELALVNLVCNDALERG
jgi:hypothetical protein